MADGGVTGHLTLAECLAAAIIAEHATSTDPDTDPDSAFLAGFAAGVRVTSAAVCDLREPTRRQPGPRGRGGPVARRMTGIGPARRQA